MEPAEKRPTEKKRVQLPVLTSAGKTQRAVDQVDLGQELAPDRPPLAWVLLGVIAIFAALVPLSMIGMWIVKTLYQGKEPTNIGLLAFFSASTVALSSLTGGYLVGRFGAKTGPRDGALSGLFAGLLLWALSRLPIGVIVLLVTGPAGYVGARIGKRARKPGD